MGAGQNSKNGWITNIGGGGLLINGEIDPSINYIYMSACVYGYIKVWVSCKMQSRFQQKMCLVYHAQNCLFLSTFETGNLNLLFYCHNCFL